MSFFLSQHAGALLPAALWIALMSCDTEEDKAFMTALYLDHRKQLFGYALRLCGSREDAEDAIQNTFLSLIPKASELRAMQENRLKAYVFVTLKNAVRMIHRKRRQLAQAEACGLLPDNSEEDVLPAPGYTWEDLMKALPGLSDRDQALLQMKYFLRESDQMFARQMNVSTGSVKTLVRRARKRLTKMLLEGNGAHGKH